MKSTDLEQLKTIIREEMDKAIANRFSPLLTKLDSVQGSIDAVKTDMDIDRSDFAEIKVSQATVERISREILSMFVTIIPRISRKVDEKTEAMVDKAAETVTALVEPAMRKASDKFLKGIPLDKKPSGWAQWWGRLWGGK